MNKVILITGASSGFGQVIAEKLSEIGIIPKIAAKEIRKKEGIEKAKKTRAENKLKKQQEQIKENERLIKERLEQYERDQLKIN